MPEWTTLLCVAHNIRSIMAAPIRSGASVIGLIEVFSAQPKAFNRNARIFLQHLSEIIATIHSGPAGVAANSFSAGSTGTAHALEGGSEEARLDVPEPIVLAPLDVPEDISPFRLRRILVLAAVAALLLVVTLLMPWMKTKAGSTSVAAPLPQEALHQAALRTPASATPASELEQLRQLAESGDANAQFTLGARYATGDGVPQDYATAAHWFTLAADQGHVVAQATLGAYYWAGRGVPRGPPQGILLVGAGPSWRR